MIIKWTEFVLVFFFPHSAKKTVSLGNNGKSSSIKICSEPKVLKVCITEEVEYGWPSSTDAVLYEEPSGGHRDNGSHVLADGADGQQPAPFLLRRPPRKHRVHRRRVHALEHIGKRRVRKVRMVTLDGRRMKRDLIQYSRWS